MRWLAMAMAMGCAGGSYDPAGGASFGGSSTMVRVAGTEWLATANHDEGTITLLDPATTEILDVARVGNEPTRIASAGNRLWATLRLDNEVVALQVRGDALSVVGRVALGSEPFGIVASPDGQRLYVAVSIDDEVVELDAATLAVLRTFPVQGEPRWLAAHPSGGTLVVATARGAGLAVIPLASDQPPYVYPFTEGPDPAMVRVTGDPTYRPDHDELYVPIFDGRDPRGPTQAYYTRDVILPAIWALPTNSIGQPNRGAYIVPGAPTSTIRSVAFSEDGATLYASMLGRREIVGIDPTPPHLVVGRSQVGHGVRGMVSAGAQLWLHQTFDVSVSPLADSGIVLPVDEPSASLDVRRGRELFYSSSNPGITAGEISCADCHFDGRSDGRTWGLDTGAWQTPSLAGPVDETVPVTWSETRDDVADEIEAVVTGPMGGTGVLDVDSLVAYINWTRLPNPPTQRVSDAALRRGERAFEKAGCDACHIPPLYTDGLGHSMFQHGNVNTPSLRGIATTPPYLHDGRAETLMDVLDQSLGQMGHPERLDEQERADLVEWLRTL